MQVTKSPLKYSVDRWSELAPPLPEAPVIFSKVGTRLVMPVRVTPKVASSRS